VTNVLENESTQFIALMNKWLKEAYRDGQSMSEKKNSKKELNMPEVIKYFHENELNFSVFFENFVSFFNTFLKDEKIKKFYSFSFIKASKTIQMSRKPLKNKETINVI